ncbi:MAG: hypothetical protein M1820_005840 [Bogoriella megaspora]|nr:MAG: hypothetical protein M1820_005840 [Bogoriella megaspora]
MGILLQKEEGRSASTKDLHKCEAILQELHKLGIRHGDVNRYNFLTKEDGAMLLDFENSQENADEESMREELRSLQADLSDESGRGAGFRRVN